MASDMGMSSAKRSHWRVIGWGIAASLVALPFVAMQFTTEVNWTGADFLFAAILVGGVGLLLELAVRMSSNAYYRAGVAMALGVSFLTIWTCGAVGMIGDEDNPLNLMFGIVLLVALCGAAIGGFRAAGMARAMAVAAAAQLLASIIGMFSDPLGGIFSAMYAALWLTSAAMFRRASVD